jgi:hypothetical protein
LPRVTAAHADIPDISGFDDIMKSLHLDKLLEDPELPNDRDGGKLTVSSIGVSGSNLEY